MSDRERDSRGDGHPTNGAPAPDEARHGRGPSRGALIAKLEDLDRELEEARAAAGEQLRTAQRATADLANYRRRVEEDRGASMGFANALLIGKLLAVLDDFDRALDHVPPDPHEAVVHEETTEFPDNQVIGELQRGYRLHDRVLRPSLVRVANNPKEH